MNIEDPRHPWSRLVVAARAAREEREAAAPYGFATRVTALGYAPEPRMPSLVERFALRAVGLSCLIALASLAFNYGSLTIPAPATATAAAQTDVYVPAHDALAIVMDLGE